MDIPVSLTRPFPTVSTHRELKVLYNHNHLSMNYYRVIHELIPPSRLRISIDSTVLLALSFITTKFSLWFGSGPMSSSSASSPSENDAESFRRDRILSTKLYFDVPTSKVPVIYSSTYDIAFLGVEKLHPFDSAKWGRICGFLIKDGILDKNCIVEPLEASKDDLLVVPPVALFPNCLVQQKVLRPFRNQVGGTILAAKLAKERGWAINVGGGFHHCSGNKGGGFCTYADISLCIHFAFVRLNISRVMIIDLDAHQGNGHETDFANDSRVYILDMFNPGIYPLDYEARRYIDQKVEVPSGTATDEYLKKLDEALEVAADTFDPELVVYNAGTDILDGDPLGMLRISPDGITTRDEKVFRFARVRNIPIVMLTSGGYMKSSAGVIADSITNLSKKCLIDTSKNPTAA
ncbi:histone deacetylase 2 isoform X2 [Morus notabilis]|uniref:histone deacetylase 2 isoform X2 n=1 Tax=Morus notabilis TaxID=981085 RepID=UPI000CED10D9|nr:histone deacetylase 2 isoform X2 [Morus notabilis]